MCTRAPKDEVQDVEVFGAKDIAVPPMVIRVAVRDGRHYASTGHNSLARYNSLRPSNAVALTIAYAQRLTGRAQAAKKCTVASHSSPQGGQGIRDLRQCLSATHPAICIA